MKALTFFFLCEGRSDEPLVEHLELLVTRAGATSALGIPRSGGGSVQQKLQTLLDDGVQFDFVVVHRDADGRDPAGRLAEVTGALAEAGITGCPVVPVQMTEAWLLADEMSIRRAVGRPSGRTSLGLPRPSALERLHDPKTALKEALLAASEATGSRRRKVAREWTTQRRILVQRLDVDGPVCELPSWQRLVEDVSTTVRRVLHDD